MFTVAPMGSTNDATLLETPTLCSTLSSVTGSVAPDELVENAISKGSRMFAKWMRGEMRPSTMRSTGQRDEQVYGQAREASVTA